jgi:SOS response regulatory protein OraA/RecX
MSKEPTKSVYNKALDLLSRQDYSISKLSAKLKSSHYDEEEIKETITKLQSLKLLNEEDYAKRRIISYIQRGQGIKLISLNLEKEKIYVSEQFVQDIYESLQVDTHQQVQELIENKCRYMRINSDTTQDDIFKLQQKLLRHLTSKGHDFELCQQLSHEFFANAKHNQSE